MLLHEPLGVVTVLKRDQREPKLFDGFESLDPQQLLLQRSDEALGDAVALERRPRRTTSQLFQPAGDKRLHVLVMGLSSVNVCADLENFSCDLT